MNGEPVALSVVLDFLSKLEAAHIYYTLASHTPGAIMVIIHVPGERWEVDFRKDGDVEIEVFESQGVRLVERLDELFERFSD